MALLGRLGEIAPSHSVSMKCVLCTSTRQEPRTAMPLPKLCVSHLQHSMIFLAKKKKKKSHFLFIQLEELGMFMSSRAVAVSRLLIAVCISSSLGGEGAFLAPSLLPRL